MNIVVIGLGSMGKRRIRLIKEMYPRFNICGIDGREDRRKEVATLLYVQCYKTITEVKESIDCAFICTSPLSHASIISECLSRGWNVFSELNLVDDGYENNVQLAKTNDCILFLSSTFFYREETKYICTQIDINKKWNYVYHIGQYLPDWHPWESYNEFFIGDKRTNGCREILAIELPWLTRAFGDINSIKGISDKMTDLNIDFNDNYVIQIIHSNGNKGALIVDVVSPVAVRKFEAYAEHAYISWNGTPDSVKEYDSATKELMNIKLIETVEHKDGYSSFIVENAYKNEIRDFFDVVERVKEPLYGFEQDKKILRLIDSLGA